MEQLCGHILEFKMAETRCKITPDSTVNLVLTQCIDQPYLEGSKDLIFWKANRLIFPEFYDINLK